MDYFYDFDIEDELVRKRWANFYQIQFARAEKERERLWNNMLKEIDWLEKQWRLARDFDQQSECTLRGSAQATYEQLAKAHCLRAHEYQIHCAIHNGNYNLFRSKEFIELLDQQNYEDYCSLMRTLRVFALVTEGPRFYLGIERCNEVNDFISKSARTLSGRMTCCAMWAECGHHHDLSRQLWRGSWVTFATQCRSRFYLRKYIESHESSLKTYETLLQGLRNLGE